MRSSFRASVIALLLLAAAAFALSVGGVCKAADEAQQPPAPGKPEEEATLLGNPNPGAEGNGESQGQGVPPAGAQPEKPKGATPTPSPRDTLVQVQKRIRDTRASIEGAENIDGVSPPEKIESWLGEAKEQAGTLGQAKTDLERLKREAKDDKSLTDEIGKEIDELKNLKESLRNKCKGVMRIEVERRCQEILQLARRDADSTLVGERRSGLLKLKTSIGDVWPEETDPERTELLKKIDEADSHLYDLLKPVMWPLFLAVGIVALLAIGFLGWSFLGATVIERLERLRAGRGSGSSSRQSPFHGFGTSGPARTPSDLERTAPTSKPSTERSLEAPVSAPTAGQTEPKDLPSRVKQIGRELDELREGMKSVNALEGWRKSTAKSLQDLVVDVQTIQDAMTSYSGRLARLEERLGKFDSLSDSFEETCREILQVRQQLERLENTVKSQTSRVDGLAQGLGSFEAEKRDQVMGEVRNLRAKLRQTLETPAVFEQGTIKVIQAIQTGIKQGEQSGCPGLAAALRSLLCDIEEVDGFQAWHNWLTNRDRLNKLNGEIEKLLTSPPERQDSVNLVEMARTARNLQVEADKLLSDPAQAPTTGSGLQRACLDARQRLIREISREYCTHRDAATAATRQAFLKELMEMIGLEIVDIRPGELLNENIHKVVRSEKRDPSMGDDVIIDVISMAYKDPDSGEIFRGEVVINRCR